MDVWVEPRLKHNTYVSF